MGHVFIGDMHDGMVVDGIYFLRSKGLGSTKAGKPFLNLTVSDRSGEIEGRVWDNAGDFNTRAAAGDFVFLQARTTVYNNVLQLNVSYLEPAPPAEVDPALFLPVCPRDVEAYWETVNQMANSLGDEHLRALCRAMLDDSETGAGLRRAPAATGVHQAYLGGLLEHVCSMMLLADKMAAHYPTLDRDLLIAGVLFHDIGKIRELAFELAFDYTDEGRLIGHLVIGVEMLQRLAATVPDFPVERLRQLEHIIVSHHGRPEYGTVKLPAFAEAALLHHLDNIDAKIFGFLTAEENGNQGRWTDRKWSLETAVYRLPRQGETGYRFNLPGGVAAAPTEKKKRPAKTEELSLFKK